MDDTFLVNPVRVVCDCLNKKDMLKKLHLSIVSPEKSIFDGDVSIVTLPGTVGSFSILPGHAPIVSSLRDFQMAFENLPWRKAEKSTHLTFRVVLWR